MIVSSPKSGVVDLAAYRAAKKNAPEQPSIDSVSEDAAMLLFQSAACRHMAKGLADSLSVASVEVSLLVRSAQEHEEKLKKLLFDNGLSFGSSLNDCISNARAQLAGLENRFKAAYPRSGSLSKAEFADELAMFGFRNHELNAMLVEAEKTDDLSSIYQLGDKTAIIERLSVSLRTGSIPVSLAALYRTFDFKFNEKLYQRMSSHYSYEDFSIIASDIESLSDRLSSPQLGTVAMAVADGMVSLLDAMDSLRHFRSMLERAANSLYELASRALYDVDTIRYTAVEEDAAALGYLEVDGTMVEWETYAEAKYRIDAYAAARLSEKIRNDLTARKLKEWKSSVHFAVRKEIEERLRPSVQGWAVEVPPDSSIEQTVMRLTNGVASISLVLDRDQYENWDEQLHLKIVATVTRDTIDSRYSNSSESEYLSIRNFHNHLDWAQVHAFVAKFIHMQETGLDWNKLRSFEVAECDEKKMSYAQLVKADLAKAIDEGVLPLGLKVSTALCGYKGVRVTVAALPQGLPVFTEKYSKFKREHPSSYIRPDDSHVDGYRTTKAYAALSRAVDEIAHLRCQCIDDGYGSDYGAVYNFNVNVMLKPALEEELLGNALLGEENEDWIFPASQFNEPSDLEIRGIEFQGNKRLTLGQVRAIYRRIFHVINDISGMTLAELSSDYVEQSLINSHLLLKEAYKRLPISLESDRGREMLADLESCRRRLSEMVEFCASSRVKLDAVKPFGLIPGDEKRQFFLEGGDGEICALDFELGERCPFTGRILNVVGRVATDYKTLEGERESAVIAEFNFEPYCSEHYFVTARGLLSSSSVRPVLGLASFGALAGSDISDLVASSNYGLHIRDKFLLEKHINTGSEVKALLQFVDGCVNRNVLCPFTGYVAKAAVIALAGDDVRPQLFIAPGRGFTVALEGRRSVAYIDNTTTVAMDRVEHDSLMERLANEGVQWQGSNAFVSDYLARSLNGGVSLTEAQLGWIQSSERSYHLNYEQLPYYVMDTDLLAGALIFKDFSGFQIISPEGVAHRLSKEQEERLKNLLSTGGVRIERSQLVLEQHASLTASE